MKCPVCKDVTLLMMVRNGVEIDYCPECRGVWLDRGELEKLIQSEKNYSNSNNNNNSDYEHNKDNYGKSNQNYNNENNSDYNKNKKKKSFFENFDIFD